MQTAVLLMCEDSIPEYIREIRRNYDIHKIPAHMTIGYVNDIQEHDDTMLLDILSKIKKFQMVLYDIIQKGDFVALVGDNQKVDKVYNTVEEYLPKCPKSGFHMTLSYKAPVSITHETLMKRIKKIKLPLKIEFTHVWIMKRDKMSNEMWYMAKSIRLK